MMHEYSHPLLTRPLVAYGSYRLREPEAMLAVSMARQMVKPFRTLRDDLLLDAILQQDHEQLRTWEAQYGSLERLDDPDVGFRFQYSLRNGNLALSMRTWDARLEIGLASP